MTRILNATLIAATLITSTAAAEQMRPIDYLMANCAADGGYWNGGQCVTRRETEANAEASSGSWFGALMVATLVVVAGAALSAADQKEAR